MATDKTFTIAGTSLYRGTTTWRFANGSIKARRIILERNDHLNIQLQELPRPMTKAEAMAFLQHTDGVAAVVPKTGRGSGMTPEVHAAHNAVLDERMKMLEAAKQKAAVEDDDWLEQMAASSGK